MGFELAAMAAFLTGIAGLVAAAKNRDQELKPIPIKDDEEDSRS